MKKWFATVALGAVLTAGVLFFQDSTQSNDQAMDLEPSVLSVGHPSFEL